MAMAMSTFSNDHLAAAIAAAAEIARNGGAFVFNPEELLLKAAAGQSSFPRNVESNRGRDSPSSLDDDDEDDHDDDDDEEDSERRIARSRERNREHARRTRLRKKAQLEALQSKVKGLKAESEVLKQSLEECSLASILVGLSHKADKTEDTVTKSLINVASATDSCAKEAEEIVQLSGGKRKRFIVPDMADKSASNEPLKLKINGKITLIGGGRTHINWKTGQYSDENGVQKQLTQNQLESLRCVRSGLPYTLRPMTHLLHHYFPTIYRRERNRMHAKMTRDRKKNFIATIEKTIDELESNNARMKEVLARVVNTHFKGAEATPSAAKAMTCPVTPESVAMVSPSDEVPPLDAEDSMFPPTKKFRHGFTMSSA